MDSAAAEARRAYYKAWRAKNKDRVHEYNARYWAKRAECASNEASRKEKIQREHDWFSRNEHNQAGTCAIRFACLPHSGTVQKWAGEKRAMWSKNAC